MSMYSMVVGHDPMLPVLLVVLRLHPSQVPRIRDCWWNGTHIVLLTRTGGGNRDEYEAENAELRALPTYVCDVDNSFDSTYAEFRYEMPENMRWVVPQLVVQSKTMHERFDEALERLKDPTKADDPRVRQTMAAMQPLLEQLANFINKGQTT